MNTSDFFKSYPEAPEEVSASNAIARMLDGLGYRLYWALHGLRLEDCDYKPCEGAKSIHEIIWHILGLVNWIYMHIYGHQMKRPKDIIEQGHETLRVIEELRRSFIEMQDKDLPNYKLEQRPFWSFINMPISDALHHVGQVAILRRAAGNPVVIEGNR